MDVRACWPAIGTLLFSIALPLAAVSESRAAKPKVEPKEVALFDALEKGQLAARFVPASEKKGVLALGNPTRTPLAVQIPETLGARPVLRQVIEPPQSLGLTLLPIQNRAVQNVAWKQDTYRPDTYRTVKIAAGGQVRIPLQGVCLQHGNPTPNASMPYQIVPLHVVTADVRIAIALQSMADGRAPQPAVQAVAWHLANGRAWRSLSRDFSKKEMQAALQLLQEVSKPPEAKTPPAPVTPSPQATPRSNKEA